MHTLLVTLATVILALAQPVAEPRRHSTIVFASAEAVWRVLASGEAWGVSGSEKAQVDLRLGGSITPPDGFAGSHMILAYEPERMLAINVVAPPGASPESAALGERSCAVFRLEPLAPDRTQLTVTLVGCSAEGRLAVFCDKLYDRYAAIVGRIGNNSISAFVEKKDHERMDAAEKLLFSLAGKWSFEQKRPDGTPFCGVSEFKPLFENKMLVADGFLTVGDKTWHHSHLVAGLDPGTKSLRLWSFNEKGDVTEGGIRLEGNDKLVLDWGTHHREDARVSAYRVEYIFKDADEFQCVVLGPEIEGSRKPIADVAYERDRSIAK